MSRTIKEIINDIETDVQYYEDGLCENDIDLSNISVEDLKELIDFCRVASRDYTVGSALQYMFPDYEVDNRWSDSIIMKNDSYNSPYVKFQIDRRVWDNPLKTKWKRDINTGTIHKVER